MKELCIIRHAKTERIVSNQQDFDRELTGRGLRQCEDLAQHLHDNLREFDVVLVSSAKRTQMTFEALKYVIDSKSVLISKELYLASAQEIMQLISAFALNQNSVLLIGHNDGISDLVSYFLDDYQHVPTSGYLRFQFAVDSWSEIIRGSGLLLDSFYSQKS